VVNGRIAEQSQLALRIGFPNHMIVKPFIKINTAWWVEELFFPHDQLITLW
jgi:hypothetical protein